MGIEPTSLAWKAKVLPLNYTRKNPLWWRGEDLNLRRLSRQIYSLIPLTTREPLPKRKPRILIQAHRAVNCGGWIFPVKMKTLPSPDKIRQIFCPDTF